MTRNKLFEKFERMLIEKAEYAVTEYGKGKGFDYSQERLDLVRIEIAIMKSAKNLSPVQLGRLEKLKCLADDAMRTVHVLVEFPEFGKNKAK